MCRVGFVRMFFQIHLIFCSVHVPGAHATQLIFPNRRIFFSKQADFFLRSIVLVCFLRFVGRILIVKKNTIHRIVLIWGMFLFEDPRYIHTCACIYMYIHTYIHKWTSCMALNFKLWKTVEIVIGPRSSLLFRGIPFNFKFEIFVERNVRRIRNSRITTGKI